MSNFEATETEGNAAAAVAEPKRFFLSVNEWKELGASFLFFALCFLAYAIPITPRHRPIPFQTIETNGAGTLYARNLSYDESLNNETIPDLLLVVLAALMPLLLQCALGKLFGRMGDAHASFCAYLVAFGLTALTTSLVKAYVGYLRPNFFDTCVPNATYSQCLGDEHVSSRDSFPSGHSSVSFCGLTLLTLYCHDRFGLPSVRKVADENEALLSDRKKPRSSKYAKDPFLYICISIASLAPMALALFIASSRIVDNLHFPADVVGGSVLGAAIANFVHGLWL